MATARLNGILVKPTGRDVEVLCTWDSPAPVDLRGPDKRIAEANSRAITVAGRTAKYIGCQWGAYNHIKPYPQTYAATSVEGLDPGRRYFLLTLSDTEDGTETSVSQLGGGWGSTTQGSGGYGIDIPAGRRCIVYFERGGIPAGKFGHLYMSNGVNANPLLGTMRAYRLNIPAGTTSLEIDTATFEDANRQPPDDLFSWKGIYLIDEDEPITYDEAVAGVTATAPIGLMEDPAGNQSPAFTSQAATCWSWVDSDGFVDPTIPTGPSGVTFYVARPGNVKGSNGNDGLTVDTPLADQAGITSSLLRGAGCRLLFQDAIDEFDVDESPHVWKRMNFNRGYGLSHEFPLYVGRYHDPEEGADTNQRALVTNGFNTNNTTGEISPQNALSMLTSNDNPGSEWSPPPEWLIVDGIHFTSNPALVTYVNSTGMAISVGSYVFFLSDCIFNDWGTAIDMAGGQQRRNTRLFSQYFTMDRCSIYDSSQHGLSAGRAQGFHTAWSESALIADSFFYNCGFRDTDSATGNALDHLWYVSFPSMNGVYRNNILDNGSNFGMWLRGGGSAYENLISRVKDGLGYVSYGGSIYKNIFFNMRQIPGVTGTAPTSIKLHSGAPAPARMVIEENLVLLNENVSRMSSIGFTTYELSPGAGHAATLVDVVIRNNTIRNAGSLLFTDNNVPDGMEWDNNLLEATATFDNVVIEGQSNALIDDWSFLSGDFNVYVTTAAVPFNSITDVTDFASWKSETGIDANGLFLSSVSYVNSAYNRDSFAQDLGHANWAALIAAFKIRPRRTWSALYSTEGMFGLWAAAFTPTSLPSFGSGDYGFAGANDYRDAEPVPSYTLRDNVVPEDGDDNGTYAVGATVNTWIKPDINSTDTINFACLPVGACSVVPSPVTFEGTSAAVACDWTIDPTYDVEAEGNGPTILLQAIRDSDDAVMDTYVVTAFEPAPEPTMPVTGVVLLT